MVKRRFVQNECHWNLSCFWFLCNAHKKCANADTIICVYDATFLCHPIQEKHDTMEHCQLKNSTPNYHGHDFTKKSVI